MVFDRKVRSVMQTEVKTVDVAEPLSAVRRLLDLQAFHHVPVVEGDRLIGILSTLDLARVGLDSWIEDQPTRDAWLDRTAIREIMTPLPEVLHPDDSLRHAAALLSDGGFHALPVVDDHQHLVGILTSTDLVRLLHAELR